MTMRAVGVNEGRRRLTKWMRWEMGEVLLGSGRSGISLKVGTAGAGSQDLAKIRMEQFSQDCVDAHFQ